MVRKALTLPSERSLDEVRGVEGWTEIIQLLDLGWQTALPENCALVTSPSATVM
jgi:hypothetical protein